MQTHLLQVFERDPHQIGAFLQCMAPRAWSSDGGPPRVGDLDDNQMKSMKLLIDLDVLADLIRQHCPGDFDKSEWSHDDERPVDQRMAEQFMFIYRRWQREGEPPDRGEDHEQSIPSEPMAQLTDEGSAEDF